MATKCLHFYTYNLRRDTTVMLMFQPPDSEKLYKDQFPVVWKVLTFRAGGHAKAVVRYCARLAFGYAQTASSVTLLPAWLLIIEQDDDNFVTSAAWVEVKSGDQTEIVNSGGGSRFGKKTEGNVSTSRLLVCKNNSKSRANLSVGFVRGDFIDQRYDPMLVWRGVGLPMSLGIIRVCARDVDG
ncbi:hypothetical protein RhiJN_22525 [Ceratobasidium sp. AG-Ba]|nr:hypothetical protein RhiJN_22525 [Ceratobasidium sp. AG-Ba]